MKQTLPSLKYPYTALEPYIDVKTMEIHHSKHHQTYVTNLSKLLEKTPHLAEKELEDLLTHLDEVPEDIRQSVKNNAGGVYNHSLFWTYMTPDQQEHINMNNELKSELDKTFGTIDNFHAEFEKAALGRFGSGWTWLVVNNNKQLEIISTANQDSPITEGKTPILGIDLWEHAYYLKYQNRRAEYIANWWSVVNWAQVSEYYAKTK